MSRLERELRWWRRAALVTALATVSLALMAQTWGAPALVGIDFVLRHQLSGREVGSWTVNERGDPYLMLFGREGRQVWRAPRSSLRHTGSHSELRTSGAVKASLDRGVWRYTVVQ